jgi:hypothetical protein
MLGLKSGKFAADQIEAFDLIFEWRQHIRQPPDVDL